MHHGDGLIEVETGVQGDNVGVVPPCDVAAEDLRERARVEVDFAVRSGHGVEERDAADDERHLDEWVRRRERGARGCGEGNVAGTEVVQWGVGGGDTHELFLSGA